MTNDGLVTLDHVSGSAGTVVVPDLAVTLPHPDDHGRTYRFLLRRGIRYSTGRLVRPVDFRRAIERDFRIGSPSTSFFGEIVGAGRCTASRCDLSRGINTDAAANTVTFHLTHADPEFLDKLTLTAAFAVPAGTPDHDVGVHPIPATGPYLIQRYVVGKSLVLIRNPRFREWSPAAQPNGYPDRIVWRFGVNPEKAVTQVERGRADWGLYEFPFSPPGDRLGELTTQFADRTHANPLPELEYFALHTRVPPFDDARVRRALNYAIDRDRLVRLYGGPALANPTCQVLPPGLPGYRRYCPYTNSRPDGRYAGPRLDVARRLVARSHTAGARVRVLTDPNFPPAHYVVSILRRLGYRASELIATGDRFDALANDSRYAVGVSRNGWAADYPDPSDFVTLLLSCHAFHPYLSTSRNNAQFCDPALDRQAVVASRLRGRDPQASDRAWARIDHELTDQAPWLPTVNLNAVDVVSSRVGNYQFHPQWGILLDQLWVR
jgi:peptide/nickel transport system substrate-binding protein